MSGQMRVGATVHTCILHLPHASRRRCRLPPSLHCCCYILPPSTLAERGYRSSGGTSYRR